MVDPRSKSVTCVVVVSVVVVVVVWRLLWCGVWWWWCVSGVGLYNDFNIPQTSKQPEFVFKNRN